MSRHSVPDGLLAARRRFFAAGERPTGLVPSVILASWQRCAALGLAAAARPAVEPMPASALHELKDRYELLRRVCRPELEALHVDARATGAIAILTGPDGFVLDAIGSADFLDKAARVSLRPGVPWREDATGTNAIGTALVEKRPVEVRGGEHYFEPHRILSCSAAPILDPFGRLAGVLDLSGEASVHHVHALGMVGLAVEQIEHRLFGELCAGRDIVRIHRDPALLGTAREGLLVFEGHRLVAANRYALELLGIGWDELGRRRYDELFAGALPAQGREAMLRDQLGTRLHARRDGAAGIAGARESARRIKPARAPRPFFDANTEADIERGVRLLDADIPILLHGETGTGKEVLARELHRRSQRAGAAFVAINCASLPESLIEAELFGYVHGAFTGARREGAQGLLREANGGVLFLDEIGDMPLSLQSRLLRVLQEREVTPLGGGRAVPVDFALIAASHRDLGEAIESGAFRADLYYRIAQNTLSIPPLRARADLRALILALWNSLGAAAAGMRLEDAALAALEAHRWPGNVRELVGVLRTLIALGEAQSTIRIDALPDSVRSERPHANEVAATIAVPMPSPISSTIPSADAESIASLGALQRDAMRRALAACGGNTSEAARRLGVSRSTLYRHLRSR
ncbi:MAG TPA: sigma-54-dependent Fis family transcriptional regulator [Rhodanobacteraceae bacterium]|nr:sigma-54-dependent Fis family transcriptional regulator [Rhodanobacteraceae bacterium]